MFAAVAEKYFEWATLEEVGRRMKSLVWRGEMIQQVCEQILGSTRVTFPCAKVLCIHSTRQHSSTGNQLEYRIEYDPKEWTRSVQAAMKGDRIDPKLLSPTTRERLGLVPVPRGAQPQSFEPHDDVDDDEPGYSANDTPTTPSRSKSSRKDLDANDRTWLPAPLVGLGYPDLIQAYEKHLEEKAAAGTRTPRTPKRQRETLEMLKVKANEATQMPSGQQTLAERARNMGWESPGEEDDDDREDEEFGMERPPSRGLSTAAFTRTTDRPVSRSGVMSTQAARAKAREHGWSSDDDGEYESQGSNEHFTTSPRRPPLCARTLSKDRDRGYGCDIGDIEIEGNASREEKISPPRPGSRPKGISKQKAREWGWDSDDEDDGLDAPVARPQSPGRPAKSQSKSIRPTTTSAATTQANKAVTGKKKIAKSKQALMSAAPPSIDDDRLIPLSIRTKARHQALGGRSTTRQWARTLSKSTDNSESSTEQEWNETAKRLFADLQPSSSIRAEGSRGRRNTALPRRVPTDTSIHATTSVRVPLRPPAARSPVKHFQECIVISSDEDQGMNTTIRGSSPKTPRPITNRTVPNVRSSAYVCSETEEEIEDDAWKRRQAQAKLDLTSPFVDDDDVILIDDDDETETCDPTDNDVITTSQHRPTVPHLSDVIVVSSSLPSRPVDTYLNRAMEAEDSLDTLLAKLQEPSTERVQRRRQESTSTSHSTHMSNERAESVSCQVESKVRRVYEMYHTEPNKEYYRLRVLEETQ